MNRRGFFKYLAAAPVAAVGTVVGARALPEVPAEGVVIEGSKIYLSNCSFEGTGITFKQGSEASMTNCFITGIK